MEVLITKPENYMSWKINPVKENVDLDKEVLQMNEDEQVEETSDDIDLMGDWEL